MKVIYVAGPMRGYEIFNFAQFFHKQVILESLGWEVLNPAAEDCKRWIKDGWVFSEDNYDEVLAYDLSLISAKADAIYMLKGWQGSDGATRELEHAKELGLEVYYEG